MPCFQSSLAGVQSWRRFRPILFEPKVGSSTCCEWVELSKFGGEDVDASSGAKDWCPRLDGGAYIIEQARVDTDPEVLLLAFQVQEVEVAGIKETAPLGSP